MQCITDLSKWIRLFMLEYSKINEGTFTSYPWFSQITPILNFHLQWIASFKPNYSSRSLHVPLWTPSRFSRLQMWTNSILWLSPNINPSWLRKDDTWAMRFCALDLNISDLPNSSPATNSPTPWSWQRQFEIWMRSQNSWFRKFESIWKHFEHVLLCSIADYFFK